MNELRIKEDLEARLSNQENKLNMIMALLNQRSSDEKLSSDNGDNRPQSFATLSGSAEALGKTEAEAHITVKFNGAVKYLSYALERRRY